MKKYDLSLHIFRRDLRLDDNTALIEALERSQKVAGCFIFDDRQIKRNEYKSEKAIQFMIGCLEDLDKQLRKKGSRLYVFRGIAEKVVEKIIKKNNINAVFINKDYTPFSLERDKKIEEVCKRNGTDFFSFPDLLLNEPSDVLNKEGKPYTVFSAFFKEASKKSVRKPRENKNSNYYQGVIKSSEIFDPKVFLNLKDNPTLKGGLKEALYLFERLKLIRNYEEEKNYPNLKKTSFLSAHIKFGTVSIRRVYWKMIEIFGPSSPILTELYWRDFFIHLVYHFPHVIGLPFNKKYQNIKWENDPEKFNRWKEGKTGFPIVDAGMRELKSTGYINNRMRMITASFLVKDLHIDWRWGEKHFAQNLVDYDVAVNNGNWQWVASTGCDSQPFFRIFNPWKQQIKYDPDCQYIKRWLPELKEFSPKEIHEHEKKNLKGYLKPIVNHKIEAEKAKRMFLKVNEI